jgi:hypothetical protein
VHGTPLLCLSIQVKSSKVSRGKLWALARVLLAPGPAGPGQPEVTARMVGWLPSQEVRDLRGLCPSIPPPLSHIRTRSDFAASHPRLSPLPCAVLSSTHACLMATRFQSIPRTWHRSMARLTEKHLEGHHPQGAGVWGLLPPGCAHTPRLQQLGQTTQCRSWSPGFGPAGVCSRTTAMGASRTLGSPPGPGLRACSQLLTQARARLCLALLGSVGRHSAWLASRRAHLPRAGTIPRPGPEDTSRETIARWGRADPVSTAPAAPPRVRAWLPLPAEVRVSLTSPRHDC